MTTFTSQEILEAAELFRPVPNDFRGVVAGIMIGINLASNNETLSDMVSVAIALQGNKTT